MGFKPITLEALGAVVTVMERLRDRSAAMSGGHRGPPVPLYPVGLQDGVWGCELCPWVLFLLSLGQFGGGVGVVLDVPQFPSEHIRLLEDSWL